MYKICYMFPGIYYKYQPISCLNPLSARIFTVFGHGLLEDRLLHKEAWVAKLLGTYLSIQVHKKVKFSWRNNLPLALKGLKLLIRGCENNFQ